MGEDGIRNQDSTKEQILKTLDFNLLKSLDAMGTDLDRLSRFWHDYLKFLLDGYTPVESFQRLRMLPQYQEDKTGFDYFCYLGLKIFTDEAVEDAENGLFKFE